MPSKQYDHYRLLTIDNLISTIERQDLEISNLKKSLKETKESRNQYYEYNKFHMEEITRLDKQIGQYRKRLKTMSTP
tara:strand:- start:433 stop:663 length:231 start_codon:yes stop_codon:yes gene_type:complete